MFGVNISIMEELDNIKTLLALLCAIDWLANDLHYRSEGTGFYEKHLLADRIRDFGDAEDQLKEAYYLGFKSMPPPYDKEIAHSATIIYNGMKGASSNAVSQLSGAFGLMQQVVDACKREASLPAGIHAVLDGISEKALTYQFLVRSEVAIGQKPAESPIAAAAAAASAQAVA